MNDADQIAAQLAADLAIIAAIGLAYETQEEEESE